MIYDTHCHLNIVRDLDKSLYDCKKSTNKEVKNIINNAKQNNITNLMQAGCSINEIDREIEICKMFSDEYINISCAIANHPENVKDNGVITTDELIKMINQNNRINYIKAIGETGLDTHKPENYDFLDKQKKSFENHIETAIKLNLPLIIHTYGETAIKQGIDMITNIVKQNTLKFVFHCYDGDYEQAKKIIDNNGIISFSGTVTFKKKTITREILSKIPIDYIVIETDSPFLAPEPFRGKQNEPSYIKYTAKYISDYLCINYDDFCYKTKNNGLKLFGQI